MVSKLLIANRGEIACRIARTAREMGITTVAVFSDADAGAMHVRACDEAVALGPAPTSLSYLDIGRVLAAARARGCDAVHPGYGFLAENPAFAEACDAAGLVFVGPPAEVMRALGGKAAAKALAVEAGVPVVPGYHGDAQDAVTLAQAADAIGYPVMIKAVAGGGGRGMRLVRARTEFAAALAAAQAEATSSFADGRVLLERVIDAPRHIEVQVFGDTHGQVVHLFERECSLQRRNQKVIEEAPAPGLSSELRAALTGAAVRLARRAGYVGAGTVEFLVAGGAWFFIEMNTRLQVEHPVTEAITGLDLVAWQLRIARGEPLPLAQDAITMRGHAIEARLAAERPARGFLPALGTLMAFETPQTEGLRVDTGVGPGSTISPHYDSLIAKLIASGADRPRALARLRAALADTVVLGIDSNAGFLAALLAHPAVAAGATDTALIARDLDVLVQVSDTERDTARSAAARALIATRSRATDPASPWAASDAFCLGPARTQRIVLDSDGAALAFHARWIGGDLSLGVEGSAAGLSSPHAVTAASDGVRGCAQCGGVHAEVTWPQWRIDDAATTAGSLVAPIDGRVTAVFVTPGQDVEPGTRIATMEAMKMEHVIQAAGPGRVSEVAVSAGQQIAKGALIARVTPA